MLPYNQTWSRSDDPLQRCRHSKFCHFNFPRWRPSRGLKFGQTGNSVIRSAVPENPSLEPNIILKQLKLSNRIMLCRDIAIWIFQDGGPAAILDFIKMEIAPFDPPTPKPHPRTKHEVNPTICLFILFEEIHSKGQYASNMLLARYLLARYRHLNFLRWRPSRHFGFGLTENSANRSAVPENPILEPKMKKIGWSIAEIWPGSWNGSHLGRHLEFWKCQGLKISTPDGFLNYMI